MTEKEIKEKAIELAAKAIQNSTVSICSEEKDGIAFVVDTVGWPKGKHGTYTSFKSIVEYFERQLKQIY